MDHFMRRIIGFGVHAVDQEQNGNHTDSITMLIACMLHSMAIPRQTLTTKPSSTVSPSTNSSGSRIAASYTSYPLPPE
ncbi:MAG: hypothetical protein WBO34_04515 [Gammaproteobacteria bacterium]